MSTVEGPVYVVGAAGHQGAAALQHLRARDVEARALFDQRDARRPRDSRQDGDRVVVAHFDDAASMERALRDAGALILVLDDPDTGPVERLRDGRAIAEGAVAAGVPHIVFSAATGADHHLRSCDVGGEIERHLRELDAPATILRPATLMEEVPWYWLSRQDRKLVLTTPFVATDHLPLVALDDIAALAALAAVRREDFLGRGLDVAGDVLTLEQIATELGEALGEPVRYEEVQVEGVFVYQEASHPVDDMEWLRTVYPPLHTFASWLEDGGGLERCRQAGEGIARGAARPA